MVAAQYILFAMGCAVALAVIGSFVLSIAAALLADHDHGPY